MYRRAFFDDVKVRGFEYRNKDKFLSLYFKIIVKCFLNIDYQLIKKYL